MSFSIRFGIFNVGSGWKDLAFMANNDPVERENLRKAVCCESTSDEPKQLQQQEKFLAKIEQVVANQLADVPPPIIATQNCG